MNGPDVAVDVRVSGPGGSGVSGCGPLSKTGAAAQPTSSGPKTVKVTVPMGAGPSRIPTMLAVSEIGLPMMTFCVASVSRPTPARVTTEVSLASLQALVTAG